MKFTHSVEWWILIHLYNTEKACFYRLFYMYTYLKWDKNEVFWYVENFGNNWKTHKNTIYVIKKPSILYMVVVSYICTQFGIYCIVLKNIDMYVYSGLFAKT